MGKILYILTTFFLMTMSCQSDNDGKGHTPTLKHLETEVIAQTLIKILHPPVEIPQWMIEAADTNVSFKQVVENMKGMKERHFDTTLFTIYLVDSLLEPYGGYRGKHNDTSYSGFEKYPNADTLKKRPIDVKMIDDNVPYNLLPIKPGIGWPDRDCIYIAGKASFSRIIFNQDYTQALFYFDYDCGLLCGSGHLIHAEKKNGQWEIFRDDLLSAY